VHSALDILVDKTDLPALGQIGSDGQQRLGRNERANTGHECECMSESAKGRRVGRKDAKDFSTVLDGNWAAQVNPLTPTSVQIAAVAAGWPRVRLFPDRWPPSVPYAGVPAAPAD
jgi:hypothetical protein